MLSFGGRVGRILVSSRRLSSFPRNFYQLQRRDEIPFGAAAARTQRRIATVTLNSKATVPLRRVILREISSRPIEFLSIPCVAAFVGILTNWMGVKMLFYPVEYLGIDLKRWDNTPYGIVGWQGVVPTKTETMAKRLVQIVTDKLLSLDEAFARLDPSILSRMLLPAVQESVDTHCDALWSVLLRPVLPLLLPHIMTALQAEIDSVLDLDEVVLTAFVRDKAVLVDLFQVRCGAQRMQEFVFKKN
jgi:hypothetical protein